MPRKISIPFDDIVKAINEYKNKIFEGHEMLVGPTHPIWADIREGLNGEISKKCIYTILKCNRNDVLRIIQIKPHDDVIMSNDTSIELIDNDSSDFEIESHSDNDIEKINFKITLSKEEWAAIHCEKKYQLNNSTYLNRN
ncbi:unnamed protein product [Macrosiphum euphorbiae]|uniref:Uncharacterized protein n=1 Tax=Macrosiphum euphorbiae TaxID=13131 RepID=A0AAV0Y3F6_9HEMI|nr:unnamed protein product [Macrosiphum euphorbiae]